MALVALVFGGSLCAVQVSLQCVYIKASNDGAVTVREEHCRARGSTFL